MARSFFVFFLLFFFSFWAFDREALPNVGRRWGGLNFFQVPPRRFFFFMFLHHPAPILVRR
jgi:hypothetical protein